MSSKADTPWWLNPPKLAIPTYDSSGVSKYLNDFRQSVTKLSKDPNTDFSPKGTVAWDRVAFEDVNAEREGMKALDYNIANMPKYADLATKSTEADTLARMNQLDQINPNWRAERDAASKTNLAWQSGEVSKDVQDKLARDNAFQSLLAGGYGGGDNARRATARDLGTTSTALQQQGQAGSQSWTNLMAGLLPQVTSTAQVMGQQGLTAKDMISTALQNATSRLAASTANSQGRMNAATTNIEFAMKADAAREQQRQFGLGMAFEGAKAYADMGTTAVGNRYATDVASANAAFGNSNRTFQIQMEMAGLKDGWKSASAFQ